MVRPLVFALFLIGIMPQWAVAARPADAPTVLNGQWRGPLKLLGGEIAIAVTIVPLADGTYYAALDAPQQRISRMPVEVELHGTDLTLRIEQAGSSFAGKVLDNGTTLSGIWKQPGVTAPMVLRQAVASVQAATKFKAAPPYRQSDVSFLNPTTKNMLGGTLTVPAGEGPFAAVVLLSDSGPQGRDAEVTGYHMFGQLADYLTRHGIAVLRFDDRGVGKSGGPAATTTADLVSDAQAGMNYLRTRPEIDLSHLGLVGHGEGGNVALLAAAQPLPPAFVVALAAYGLPGRDIVVQQQATTLRTLGTETAQVEAATKRQLAMLEIIRQTTDNAQAQAIVANMLKQNNAAIDNATAQSSAAEMTSTRYRYFLAFNPIDKLPSVNCPVLLLNGTSDLTINAEANLAVLKKGLNLNKNIVIKKLVGVNHLFQPDPTKWPVINGQPQPNFSPEAQETIREWIMEQAKK